MTMKRLRTETEGRVGQNVERIFLESPESVETKLENFTKYVRRQQLKRFIAMHELFKLVLPVKGSVIECGVYQGFGLMAWAKLSAMLEPENLTRRIYGFDTFEGFPLVDAKDTNEFGTARPGDLKADCYGELLELIKAYDADRFLGHIGKVELIKGDIAQTLPAFIAQRQHLVVSLLFIDCDLYEPTRVALEHVIPRMPKGAVVAFDELDNPIWPGETAALIETIGLSRLKLRRFEWDPYIAYAVLD
jgi:Methyltransferase domain